MKLEATRLFLRDWLACKESVPRLGHYGNGSRVDIDVMYRRHQRNQGGIPKDVFLQKRAYMMLYQAWRVVPVVHRRAPRCFV